MCKHVSPRLTMMPSLCGMRWPRSKNSSTSSCLDVQTTFQVSPVSETVVYAEDAEAASRRAVTQRPELQQAQLKVKQAEYDRRMKQAEYIPDVSLAFSYL